MPARASARNRLTREREQRCRHHLKETAAARASTAGAERKVRCCKCIRIAALPLIATWLRIIPMPVCRSIFDEHIAAVEPQVKEALSHDGSRSTEKTEQVLLGGASSNG